MPAGHEAVAGETASIAQPGTKATAYGAPEAAVPSDGPGEGAAASAEPHVFEWEARGHPWQLLISAGGLVVRQYVALAVICYQVFFMGDAKKKYLMSCNPYEIGFAATYFCEYSKTCVRCFPLMAMVVTMVVAARLILNQRAFYLMLRRGVLVDFDNFSPLRDPLFWILLWTLASSFLHFILDLCTSGDISNPRSFDSRGLLIFYFVPVIYFLMFLYTSYDIEDLLLPLSKYWEEDPEWARKSSLGMVFVEEHVIADAVLQGGLRFRADGEAEKELARRQREGGGGFELSRWRHVSRMWAGHLLLDPGLSDDSSRDFWRMWLVFSAASLAAMLLAFVFFGYQIVRDLNDIFRPPYENTDIPSLLVECLYLVFTGVIAF
eukprot:CAMPEP_0168463620 /NCGR_PEP_ID=MMETSP0228-20121227/55152_1 /TAXON_ID=133427 /ORGANISM="Protoceratium reticulatum, Strain CCCM 535 (=CCMP 1889)" /LENGTH=377 /DNA_ID=CAMNT_0008479087 /DNA_START=91 /DNA_END=1221 /DNA_ORIENTATION=+